MSSTVRPRRASRRVVADRATPVRLARDARPDVAHAGRAAGGSRGSTVDGVGRGHRGGVRGGRAAAHMGGRRHPAGRGYPTVGHHRIRQHGLGWRAVGVRGQL